jgi:hypothetical protein
VRSLICQTAHSPEIFPLSISFTGTLRVIRRAVPKFQRLEPQEISESRETTQELSENLLQNLNPKKLNTEVLG